MKTTSKALGAVAALLLTTSPARAEYMGEGSNSLRDDLSWTLRVQPPPNRHLLSTGVIVEGCGDYVQNLSGRIVLNVVSAPSSGSCKKWRGAQETALAMTSGVPSHGVVFTASA